VRKLSEWVMFRLYLVGWAVVRWLPEPWTYAIFRMFADYAWRRRGKGVTRLETNLARVLGKDVTAAEIRAVSHEGMRNYLRYWCDAFRLETWSVERVRRTFHIESEQYLRELLASGRGVILALPHMGNWDHAGAWAATITDGFTTVQERLHPQQLYDRFLAYRESLGMEVLPADGGHAVFAGLLRRLRAGGMVCLVADRDLTATGIPVDFFGETTKMPAGPAAAAVATGAALMPVTLWYNGEHLNARVHPEIPVPATGTRQEKVAVMTQELADEFAAGIAAHPADWHMLQRLWLADLPKVAT
jgi:KDO2-lipid IV(A) lauroyltransferase